MLELKFKRLTDTMTVPTKAHSTDACWDLYADIPNEEYSYTANINPDRNSIFDGISTCVYFEPVYKTTTGKGVLIPAHQTVKIPTGFATNIPHGFWGAVFARSGLATKQGLRPANCVAVIDEPYTGEWLVPIHNDTNETQIIHHGDRIAQFTLLPYFDTNFIEVNELETTERGDCGFGSSGK